MFLKLIRRLRVNIPPTPLGRWERTCNIKNNIKIDWANTDHCGTCLYKKQVQLFLPLQKEFPLKETIELTENKLPPSV